MSNASTFTDRVRATLAGMSPKGRHRTMVHVICAIAGVEAGSPEAAGVARALSSRGPKAGMLKRAQPPCRDGMALCAWMGLQDNPWRISPWAMMLCSPEEKALFVLLAKHNWRAVFGNLDQHRAALEALGVF